MIEAHVHGLPTPTVKFYRDGHLLHARKNKIVFFLEDKEIFQCLMVRPDASVSGTYTVLAENKAGKRRFDHHVDFVTKYPLIHLPGMRHADKNLDDFVEEMLEKIPKQPEQQPEGEVKPDAEKGEKDGAEKETVKEEDQAKAEISETPKAEEIADALQAVVEGEEAPKPKKHKSKRHHHHRKRAPSPPKIDADLVDDGEDEVPADDEPAKDMKRKFSAAPPHEPYETETFRIFNSKQSLVWSGKLRDQTAIEGTTIKLICAVTGPTPIIKWLKNGKPVPWGNNMRNMSGEGLGHVIMEKIARSDAGTYTCSAKNQFSEVITEAVIKVIPKSTVPLSDASKPTFTRVLGEFYHHTEDDLILDAHVRAVPEPKVVWYKDGQELTLATDPRYDFTTDHDGGYQFRIHKPNAADSALYACEAVNEEGKAKITHKVNFTELERHTHPQFVYHKESFWQPTLRMSIEPEPVKESSVPAPEITQATSSTGSGSANVPISQDTGSSDNQESGDAGDSSAGAPSGGSGSGGDGNEDGDDGKDISKEPADGGEETGEEEEKKQKRPERRAKPRRRRYEGPVEPLLIRDSVSLLI